uniref:Uncharacterized protein n=1 Tax=Anguilla anguilla TaxID=7936 RepID=A0A0E9VQQ9_ANGAN
MHILSKQGWHGGPVPCHLTERRSPV